MLTEYTGLWTDPVPVGMGTDCHIGCLGHPALKHVDVAGHLTGLSPLTSTCEAAWMIEDDAVRLQNV